MKLKLTRNSRCKMYNPQEENVKGNLYSALSRGISRKTRHHAIRTLEHDGCVRAAAEVSRGETRRLCCRKLQRPKGVASFSKIGAEGLAVQLRARRATIPWSEKRTRSPVSLSATRKIDDESTQNERQSVTERRRRRKRDGANEITAWSLSGYNTHLRGRRRRQRERETESVVILACLREFARI